MWERLIEGSKPDTVSVLVNRANMGFWNNYLYERKPDLPFSIFVEPHEREEDFKKVGVFNRILHILQSFAYRSPSYIISPIMFFEDSSFLNRMWDKPSVAVKRMKVENGYGVDVSLLSKIKDIHVVNGYTWALTGVFSGTENVLRSLGERQFNSILDAIVYLFKTKNVNFQLVKVRGTISFSKPLL
ncbi:MAG: hypothetical protein ACPL3B_05865 [Fervidobacterium sp.]